ncbi:MAG: cytochrome C oxidase subunit IV family protein [Planctomycetota bacterium]|nr:cytochrome C oxidase subunit IV family protein [Planctomycetota bacterium]
MSLSTSNQVPAPIADDVGPHDPHGVHAVPKRILLGVYAILIVFTVITVTVSKIDLGQFNIWVALGIAVVKATLVALFFMHLRWDSPFNAVVLVAAFFFVALFIGIALLDSHEYQPIIKPTPPAQVPQ